MADTSIANGDPDRQFNHILKNGTPTERKLLFVLVMAEVARVRRLGGACHAH